MSFSYNNGCEEIGDNKKYTLFAIRFDGYGDATGEKSGAHYLLVKIEDPELHIH
jgi:hypothetical protein